MSTINPTALCVLTTDDTGSFHESVMLAACDDCGALIINAETHRTACPRLKPERPEPITPDRHEWAQIIHAHRVIPGRIIEAPVSCTCGQFVGEPWTHSQHVAAMIANHVEATR